MTFFLFLFLFMPLAGVVCEMISRLLFYLCYLIVMALACENRDDGPDDDPDEKSETDLCLALLNQRNRGTIDERV